MVKFIEFGRLYVADSCDLGDLILRLLDDGLQTESLKKELHRVTELRCRLRPNDRNLEITHSSYIATYIQFLELLLRKLPNAGRQFELCWKNANSLIKVETLEEEFSMSKLALALDLMQRGVSLGSNDDFKQSSLWFQDAACIFRDLVSETVQYPHLKNMHHLALAQAQESVWRQAIQNNLNDSSISRLGKSASDLYSDALQQVTDPKLKSYLEERKDEIDIQNYYRYAKVLESKKSYSTAIKFLVKAQELLWKTKKSNKELLLRVTRVLEELRRDNDFVHHQDSKSRMDDITATVMVTDNKILKECHIMKTTIPIEMGPLHRLVPTNVMDRIKGLDLKFSQKKNDARKDWQRRLTQHLEQFLEDNTNLLKSTTISEVEYQDIEQSLIDLEMNNSNLSHYLESKKSAIEMHKFEIFQGYILEAQYIENEARNLFKKINKSVVTFEGWNLRIRELVAAIRCEENTRLKVLEEKLLPYESIQSQLMHDYEIHQSVDNFDIFFDSEISNLYQSLATLNELTDHDDENINEYQSKLEKVQNDGTEDINAIAFKEVLDTQLRIVDELRVHILDGTSFYKRLYEAMQSIN